MQFSKDRKPWQLKAKDFGTSKVYAEQDWRFQLFFEYLRISPSYAMAAACKNVEELTKLLGDRQQAIAVWKTYNDVGDVFGVLYRDWWLSKGIGLFGIKSARPRVESVAALQGSESPSNIVETSTADLSRFLQSRYTEQGMPTSLLVSIPIGLKRAAMLKQLKAMLDALELDLASTPKGIYVLAKNKMRQSRLLSGLRLVYMKAAKPKDELWRASARAKISKTHNDLNPSAEKKDIKSAEARRMLTIMASRLLHDTLIIAENAARGIFPSLEPVGSAPFEFAELGKRLARISRFEKAKKEQLLASKKAGNVK